MGHQLTALILKGDFDASKAHEVDLRPVSLGFGLTLFHINHYYSAYWQYQLRTTGHLHTAGSVSGIFPTEMVLAEIMRMVSCAPRCEYALIQTDYFGGIGEQYAQVFYGEMNADTRIRTVSQALNHLGVVPTPGMDEFDTVGLAAIRSQPDWLDKYAELAEKYGL